MDINTSLINLNSQTPGFPSAQITTSATVSPVQRLEAASGMNSPAMKELLAPVGNELPANPTSIAFDAQAQLVDSSENVTGSLVDIIA